MPANTYKNISGVEQVVIGVGVVGAGETIETEQEIINGNFEKVVFKPKHKK